MKNPSHLKLSNLDKVYFKKDGITKGEVVAYYESVAPTLLPYLKDRPMVLNRHPNGIDSDSFFQKHVDTAQLPDFIHTCDIKHHHKSVRYLLVQDLPSLLYVANLGCIELNPFHARVGHLNFPDWMVLDLDPEDVPFSDVVRVAQTLYELLNELSLESHCKTSGKRGLHIYVPTQARYAFEQVHLMANLIAHLAQIRLPHLISLERSPKKRQKRVYIDVPRNSAKQTLVAPYSLRPVEHAPVSTPLHWREVVPELDPLAFNLRSLSERIERIGDPFLRMGLQKQNLTQALKRAEALAKSTQYGL